MRAAMVDSPSISSDDADAPPPPVAALARQEGPSEERPSSQEVSLLSILNKIETLRTLLSKVENDLRLLSLNK